jgi:nucleoid DNA-binding protein
MQPYIHKYFALNKSLSLPGIGSFTVETQNAKLDFIDKTLHAPAYTIRYNKYDGADEKFYDFLARETGVEENDAMQNFKSFSDQLKEQLERDHRINLQGIGTLTTNGSGYDFVADNSVQKYFPSITAERIIRQNAEHTVKVGEDERTSTQMHEHFQQRTVKEDNWFVHALILGAIGIAAIAIYYLLK